MKRGGIPVFMGPQREAEQVQAVLEAEGVPTELIQQAGGWVPWGAPSAFDARVMVPVGQVPRARAILRRNPRWKPVDAKTDLAEAETSYRIFVIAAVVVLALGTVGIAAVLLYGR